MYAIEISPVQYDAQGQPHLIDVDMNKVREACADLIEGIDQTDDAGALLSSSIVVDGTVSEAVKRINALGYSTDEDDVLDEE